MRCCLKCFWLGRSRFVGPLHIIKFIKIWKSHTCTHTHTHTRCCWSTLCGSQVQAERLISPSCELFNIFGTSRRIHVAFYDFHTLPGCCPTAKFNYHTAAESWVAADGGSSWTTWRANYACRPSHLIGVFKGHTRTRNRPADHLSPLSSHSLLLTQWLRISTVW